jgi:hypothetical protein
MCKGNIQERILMKDKTQKLFFTDLDDTLFDTSKIISSRIREDIKKASDKGQRVILCSGRPFSTMRPLIEDLELGYKGNYVVSFNGGLILEANTGKTLFKKEIPNDLCRKVMKICQSLNIHSQFYDEEGVLTPDKGPEIKHYAKLSKGTYKFDPDLSDNFTGTSPKIEIIDLNSHSKLDHVKEIITDKFGDSVDLFFSNPYYLEVMPKGVSKGSAVKYLSKFLGIAIENTVAVGDSDNDLSMIKAAGVGCAMANAIDSVKKAADYITVNDCDHSGVAEVLEKFIL